MKKVQVLTITFVVALTLIVTFYSTSGAAHAATRQANSTALSSSRAVPLDSQMFIIPSFGNQFKNYLVSGYIPGNGNPSYIFQATVSPTNCQNGTVSVWQYNGKTIVFLANVNVGLYLAPVYVTVDHQLQLFVSGITRNCYTPTLFVVGYPAQWYTRTQVLG